MADEIVVFITTSNPEEASKIARALVEERLSACVNIIKSIRSIYRWQKEVQDEEEALLIVKTRGELFERLEKRVRELHSYTVPEVIAISISEGSAPYLKWLRESTEG